MGWQLLAYQSRMSCDLSGGSSAHPNTLLEWDFIEIGMRHSTDVGLKRVQSIRSIASLKRQLDRNNLLWLTVTVS